MQPTLINGVFAMLTCAALAGLIFYCIGLRTGKAAGRKQGADAGNTTCPTICDDLLAQNLHLLDTLGSIARERDTLRDNIKAEAASYEAALARARKVQQDIASDFGSVISNLRAALQAESINRLTADDWLSLKLAAKQLGQAASQHTRSGSTKTNQAAVARDRINALAERVKATVDQQGQPCEWTSDTELLDWLEDNAMLEGTQERMAIEFPITTHPDAYPSIRALLRAAIEQQVQRTARPASSAWERVDEHQAGPSMCL